MTTSSHSLPSVPRERAGWNGIHIPFGINGTTLSLLAIVILAAALRLTNIGAIGQANTYYTAAVESMLQSWHNFFFVAAEPGGSVSIDKPPVGLWLQAISAYFLGVNGFAVVLPQILAGIGSVVLVFHLVRRSFGNVAGLIAAFALAVTPVAIAVERNNTPDGMLIFTLLLGAWAFIKATETRKLRFLLLGAVLVGVGFNIKMMQAFLPLPAFYALYLFGSQGGWWRKILHLGLTTLVLLPVAFSWATIVDLTPADQRPYVGSSQNNSAFNLIFGYNGLQRLEGGMGGGGPRNTAQDGQGNGAPPIGPQAGGAAPQQGGQAPTDGRRSGAPTGGPGGPGEAGGMFGTGQRGIFRLFQSGLAAQVSWLLPFGLIMIVAMAASMSWWRPHTERHRGLILWGGWLITCVVFFSVAGFFHQYYLAMLGAPLAAIVAMGIAFLWQLRAEHPVRATLLLFAAAGVTLAYQVYAVTLYQSLGWWLAIPGVLAIAGVMTLLLSLRTTTRTIARLSFALIVAALLTTPTVWSGLTTAHASQNLPEAYSGNSRGGMPGAPGRPLQGTTQPGAVQNPGGGRGVNTALLEYLQAHTQDTKYLVVVPSSGAGAEYVLQTGRPVLYAGGFSGNDPVIDGNSLAKLVANGDVRYVLWGNNDGGGRGGNASITSYLQSSCSVVTDASIGVTQNNTQRSFGPGGGAQTLYQCGS